MPMSKDELAQLDQMERDATMRRAVNAASGNKITLDKIYAEVQEIKSIVLELKENQTAITASSSNMKKGRVINGKREV